MSLEDSEAGKVSSMLADGRWQGVRQVPEQLERGDAPLEVFQTAVPVWQKLNSTVCSICSALLELLRRSKLASYGLL